MKSYSLIYFTIIFNFSLYAQKCEFNIEYNDKLRQQSIKIYKNHNRPITPEEIEEYFISFYSIKIDSLDKNLDNLIVKNTLLKDSISAYVNCLSVIPLENKKIKLYSKIFTLDKKLCLNVIISSLNESHNNNMIQNLSQIKKDEFNFLINYYTLFEIFEFVYLSGNTNLEHFIYQLKHQLMYKYSSMQIESTINAFNLIYKDSQNSGFNNLVLKVFEIK